MKTRSIPSSWSFLTPVDVLVLGYQALLAPLVLFGQSGASKFSFLAAHVIGSLLLVAFCRSVPAGRSGPLGFLREWYPLIVMTFLYREIGPLVHSLFDGSLDASLAAADQLLFFGGGPAIWQYQTLNPPPRWLNEVFNLGYGFYFFLMPIGGFTLWFAAPRREFRTYMFTLCLTLYAHYLMFIFLPAHSPRFFLPGLREALPGYLWSDLLKVAVEGNAYPGGSFPSSHVAAAFIVFRAYPYLGRWKPLFFALTLLLFAGTVWGRYHYVSDLAVGLVMGWFFNRVSPWVESMLDRRLHANVTGRNRRPAES